MLRSRLSNRRVAGTRLITAVLPSPLARIADPDGGWRRARQLDGGPQRGCGVRGIRIRACMNQRQRSSGADPVARSRNLAESHAVVDQLVGPRAPAAEGQRGKAHGACRHRGDPGLPIDVDRHHHRSPRQVTFVAVDEIVRPARCGDHALKRLRPPTAVQRLLDGGLRIRHVLRQATQNEELPTQGRDHFPKTRLAPDARQVCHRLPDLQGIADGIPEHLVHVGDDRARGKSGAVCGAHDAVRQLARAGHFGHEGAVAGLDVHHQPVEAGGELLREDRGGDQRYGVDGRRNVADGVQPPVRRGQIVGRPDDRASGVRDDALKGVDVGGRVVAGYRIELVEGAPGVAEAAPGDHGHRRPACGQERCQNQAGLVADAAGGVLVEDRASEIRPLQDPARHGHRPRQRGALGCRHAVEADRHRERCRLAFGDRAVADARDERGDHVVRQRQAVAFRPDYLLRQIGGHRDRTSMGSVPGLCPRPLGSTPDTGCTGSSVAREAGMAKRTFPTGRAARRPRVAPPSAPRRPGRDEECGSESPAAPLRALLRCASPPGRTVHVDSGRRSREPVVIAA